MNKNLAWPALVAMVAIAAPAMHADVKTREKTTFAMEGVMGGLVRMFGGKAAREGVTATVAVKGNRKSSFNDSTGEIIDLTEEKVYSIDVKKKEYRVVTFAEMRAQFRSEERRVGKESRDGRPPQRADRE